MKYAWISSNRQQYSIPMMCDLLGVSRSGFYQAAARRPGEREHEEQRIVEQIRQVQRKHRGRYGRRRMTPEVSDALGHTINHKRVGRLMRKHDLNSRKRRPFRVVTTDSRHDHPIAPNVLDRDFSATGPDQKWLSDMTYVRTDEGWLYLALVIDLFSRKIIGWASSATMPQELTIEALQVALGWRNPGLGLMHHSDRGSQYAAKDYRKALAERGITVSMSRKGNCWDNAPMESLNGTLKVECVHDEHFRTRSEAHRAIIEYISYYNTERRHSSLGYVSPAQFERRWRAERKNPPQEPMQ